MLLRSLFLLKRTRSFTFFIPLSHVRYIFVNDQYTFYLQPSVARIWRPRRAVGRNETGTYCRSDVTTSRRRGIWHVTEWGGSVTSEHVIRTQTKQVFIGEIETWDTDADKTGIYWWHWNMWYGRRQNRYLLLKLEHVIRTSNVTSKYLFCLRPYLMFQFHQ